MKPYLLLVLAIFLIAGGGFLAARARSRNAVRQGTFTKRPIATANEQMMYWRLLSAFPDPEYVVLTQVSFGALLTAKGGAIRYSFSQKIADFVLLDKSFKVLSVIELDDSSHRGREGRDASRDAMLAKAGYKILRYKNIPQPEKLWRDIAGIKKQMTSPVPLE